MSEPVGLVSDGTSLAIVGMGTVFVFLTVLVGVTNLMSWLVGHFVPGPADTDIPTLASVDDEAQLVAVISAAIHAHRTRSPSNNSRLQAPAHD